MVMVLSITSMIMRLDASTYAKMVDSGYLPK